MLQVFIQNPGGPDSAWNLPDELSVGQAVQIRVSPQQGVTKRCRLSWLTNSVLVYEPKCGGMGGGLRGLSQPVSTVPVVHRSLNKLWRSNSILTYVPQGTFPPRGRKRSGLRLFVREIYRNYFYPNMYRT